MKLDNYISVTELCTHYSIERNFVSKLSEIGLLDVMPIGTELHIDQEAITVFEKIIRLHRDLQINPEGIDVILQLLDKMNHMETELQTLRNRLKIINSL